MALRNILTKEQPLLYKKSRRVTDFNPRLHQLLDDMNETLMQANGVGLAAPQIGVMRRVFIMNDGEKIWELINPEILVSDDYHSVPEGCLSLPGVSGMVDRPNHVKVRAMNRDSELCEMEFFGLMAQCCQHEYDHLEGILFDSKITGPVPEKE